MIKQKSKIDVSRGLYQALFNFDNVRHSIMSYKDMAKGSKRPQSGLNGKIAETAPLEGFTEDSILIYILNKLRTREIL